MLEVEGQLLERALNDAGEGARGFALVVLERLSECRDLDRWTV